MFLNIVVKYCAFLRHCEKSAQVTAKSPHRSRTSMYAPSADFSCFLNCVQNPALKLLPDWEFWGNFFLRESGNFFLKKILRSRVFLVVLKYCSDVLRFLRHCEKSAQVTYVNVRSQRGLFLFLELRAKSRLKTTAGLGVF